MANAHKGFRPLTPHKCGKCRDHLVEQELEENRLQGRFGKDARCWNCDEKKTEVAQESSECPPNAASGLTPYPETKKEE